MDRHAVISLGVITVGSIFCGVGAGWPVGVGVFLIAFALMPNLNA